MLKKIIAAILIALMLASTTLAFAWWDELTQTEAESNLIIGQGLVLNVEAVAETPEGKVLVPYGYALGLNDVETIELTYSLTLDQEAVVDLDLNITVSDILIGGSTTNSELINFDITQSSYTINTNTVDVTVTISVTNPDTYETYLEIMNQEITFTLTFEASRPN